MKGQSNRKKTEGFFASKHAAGPAEALYDHIIEKTSRDVWMRFKRMRKTPLPKLPPERQRWADLLGRAFITAEEYRSLRSKWIEKGWEVWRPALKAEHYHWRKQLFERLSSSPPKQWKDLITLHDHRPNAEEKKMFDKLFEESGCDPLFLMNLCGVPPQHIVLELQLSKENKESLDRFYSLMRRRGGIHDLVGRLKLTAELFKKHERLVIAADAKLDELADVNSRAAETLDAFVTAFQLQRGRQTDSFFASTAQSLFSWCDGELLNRLKEQKRARQLGQRQQQHPLGVPINQPVSIGMRILVPAIAIFMVAAFPEDFDLEKDPVRKVRRLLKLKVPLRDRAARWLLN